MVVVVAVMAVVSKIEKFVVCQVKSNKTGHRIH
jgi:hypothetical protein